MSDLSGRRWNARLASLGHAWGSRFLMSMLATSLLAGTSTTFAANAAPAKEPGEALILGMSYVAPPHTAGAKVRTPEGLAPVLAERLGERQNVQVVQVDASPETLDALAKAQANRDTATEGPQADALLIHAAPPSPEQGLAYIATGYRAGIMAIMRSDTDIQRWEDLRGRTVCLTEEGGLAGKLADRYGAHEKVFKAAADALLDLRVGGCDAAVHNSTLLNSLVKFPEWKKFSASLPVQEERELVFVAPANASDRVQVLQNQVSEWQAQALYSKLTDQAARDIAFEVYMDQEVPDCH